MLTKNIYFFLALLVFCQGISQNNPADSLIKVLHTLNEDTNRVNLLNEIIKEYGYQADFTNAKAYGLQAITLADKISFTRGKAVIYKTIGNLYSSQADYPKALEFYISSLKIRDSLNDMVGAAAILTNIGNTYSKQEDYSQALEYCGKALKIYEENKMQKTPAYVNALLCQGTSYEGKKEYDKALEYYLKIKEIAELLGDEEAVAISLNNMGNISKEHKKYDEALSNYFKALEIRNKIEDQEGIATTLQNMGAIYNLQKRNKEAIEYGLKSLTVAKGIEALDLVKDAEGLLSQAYEDLGDKPAALLHYKEFVRAKDSLFSAENIKNVAKQEFRMVEEKMEAGFKEEQIKKEAELQQQKIIRYAFTAGFALVLILILVVFRSLRLSKHKNKIIEAQKAEVEVKNDLIEHKQKEILDSITYAQRIQQALMASDSVLRENLPDHFVFFQPKDIVSGDFYWAIKNKDLFYLATADSTGHGVPGAFMSLLNISFLNDAINGKNIEQPALMLDYVRKNLIESLRTDGSKEGGRDGMDCVVCAYDFKTLTLHYGAANNSFYILRERDLIYCKADKMPVGRSPRDHESFSVNSIQLMKGDIVYTLTDGMPDQFGGPKGKKYKYKPLEELLVSIGHLPMPNQKEKIKASFENWKGEYEQVDDVLLIGVKI